jgi:hypothetical protein
MRKPQRPVTARAQIRETAIERAQMIIREFGGGKLRTSKEAGRLSDWDTGSWRHKRSRPQR